MITKKSIGHNITSRGYKNWLMQKFARFNNWYNNNFQNN